jgi:predicted aspartyl protease
MRRQHSVQLTLARDVRPLVAVAGLVCVALPSTFCRAEVPESIVLETISGEGRPVVSMTLNGDGPFQLFVDTGAGGNVLSAELAGRLGLESVGTQRIFNPAGGAVTEADIVQVAVAESGAMRLEDLRFLAADMPQLGGNHGVLSVHSLPPGLVTFDLAGGTVRIEPGALEEDGVGVMPCEIAPLLGVAGEVAGRPLTFHVDTGSPDGITLPGGLARELDFDGELVVIRERGPLIVKSGRLRGTVRIGPLVLENPEVQVVDLFRDFGNLGSRFLWDRVLTIDRARGLLRLASAAEPGNTSQDRSPPGAP